MKRSFNPKKQQSQGMSILTSPYFVIGLVVVCFGILTPKIFLPLFMQIFGLNQPSNTKTTTDRNMDPRMRPGDSRSGPQFGRPGPVSYSPPAAEATSGKSSLLTMLLPVYAIGIGIYMFYTLCKVFKKDDEKEENDSDFEECEKRNIKFKDNLNALDQVWDPNTNEFKPVSNLKSQLVSRSMSEESEDELNEYAKYNSVDPDYLAYLKQARRQKKVSEKGALLSKTAAGGSNNNEEIALTPGTGLTSITNTNVLMNDTLERMKHSLNKINGQLVDVERKGHPMEDPELDGIRLQLTQTELQMQKIMTIVNSVSASLDMVSGDDEGEVVSSEPDEYVRYHNKAESKGSVRNRRGGKKVYVEEEESRSVSSESLSSNDSEFDGNEMLRVNTNAKMMMPKATEQVPVKAENLKNKQRNAKKKQRRKAKAMNES